MNTKILEAGKNENGVLSPPCRRDGTTARAETRRGLERLPIAGQPKESRHVSERGRETEGPYARPSTILTSTRFIVQGGIWRRLCSGEKASPLPRP